MDLTKQIEEEFEIEQKNKRPAVSADDIPVSYELITPEWLTHFMCKGYPGAKVLSHRLDVPDEGNTNRRRIFLTYNEAGNAAKLPGSVFCKAAQRLANRLVLASCGLTNGEVTFYNKVRPLLNIEAPKCFLATYHPRSYNCIIVLEDQVPLGGKFCNYTPTLTRAQAESQLSLLAKMHGRFYQKMASDPTLANWRTFEDTFNFSDGWFNLNTCCGNGFRAAEHVIPPRLFRRHAEIWPATLKSADLHRTQPRTLTHTDTHLRNWYIAPGGAMGLADWQGIAGGDWGRDVAYAMSTALSIDDRRAWERDLLQYYLDKLHEAGAPTIGFNEAWNSYRRHLFTSLAWWTLTLTPSSGSSEEAPPDFQPKDACLEFIRRMSTTIDDLEALDSF